MFDTEYSLSEPKPQIIIILPHNFLCFLAFENLTYLFFSSNLFLKNFLQKYGYLSFDDIHSNHLNSQRKLDFLIHDAIKKLQSSFSLPITGIADNSTLELIKKPRCSYPDFFPTSAEHRVKRYSLFGSKWPTLSITYK